MALTPDGSQLIVADFGGQKIYLLDPVNGSGTIVPVGSKGGFFVKKSPTNGDRDAVQAEGYGFQIEMTYRASVAGARIRVEPSRAMSTTDVPAAER